jgi:hypothetical protein
MTVLIAMFNMAFSQTAPAFKAATTLSDLTNGLRPASSAQSRSPTR